MKMIVACKKCDKRYRISPEQIPGAEINITCPGCGEQITIVKPDPSSKAEKPGRREAGHKELETLDLSHIDSPQSFDDHEYDGPILGVIDLGDLDRYIEDSAVITRENDRSTYSPAAGAPQTARPEIIPGSGKYSTKQTVVITCRTKGAVIRVTTDGTDPTENSPMYENPVSVGSSATIKARAYMKDLSPSDLAEETYKIILQADQPEFSLKSGAYSTSQILTLTCSTVGAKICFTTDGSEPTMESLIYATPIGITEPVTIKARAFKEGWKPSKTATEAYEITGQVSQPTFWVQPGTYDTPQKVEILCATPKAEIHYTLGSDDPTKTSTRYAGPLEIVKSTIIKAKAFKSGWAHSEKAVGEYEITGQVEKPKISPPGGLYIEPQKVAIECSTPAAEIRYTADGSSPTLSSTIYANPLEIAQTMILTVRAFKPGWQDSLPASANYKITGTVAEPMFSLSPGSYTATQTVFLSCATPKSEIHYTLDGSEPTDKSTLYDKPLLVHKNTTVKARAYRPEWAASPIVDAEYKITGTVMAPVFSIPPGTYYQAQILSLACPTPEALIYYTLDGTEPTENSTEYMEPIQLRESTTVTARAFKEGWATSSHLSGYFEITGDVVAPEPSLPSGTYASGQEVTLSCKIPGTEIFYTLDGSEPTRESSLYSGPIRIYYSLTLTARAFKPGWRPSEAVSSNYEVTGIVAAPSFSLKHGSYSTAQTVFLSCLTSDVQIHYTLDGTEPTKKSKLYEGPINLSQSTAVKARAMRTGWTSSKVVEATYKITGTLASPVFSIVPGTYPRVQTLAIACSSPEALIYYTLDGSEPDKDSILYTQPIRLTGRMTVTAKAFKADWTPSNVVSGTYEITGVVSTPVILLPPGSYAEHQETAITCDTPEADIYYTTDGSEPSLTSMVYSRPIAIAQSMVLTAKAFKPGWKAGASVSASFEITGSVAPPEFSLPAGNYTSRQVLFISCTTPEAKIRYTTDGAEPTSKSKLFTESFDIKENITVRAKAYRKGWMPSTIVKAEYQITGRASPPRFSLPPGIYTSEQSLTLTCNTDGAKIHYTIDRTEPTESSTPYQSPLRLTRSCTIFARAFKPGWVSSEVIAATYEIFRQVLAPSMSLEQGAYDQPKSVSISCPTSGASIHYTMDGTEPTESSARFDGPLTVDRSATIAARAFKPDWMPSEISWNVYHIVQPESQPPIPQTDLSVITADAPDETEVKADLEKKKPKIPLPKAPDVTATIPVFDIEFLTQSPAKSAKRKKSKAKPLATAEKDKAPVVKGPLPAMQYIVHEEWFEDGMEIIEQGKYGNWFWVILEGAVDVVHETTLGKAPIIRLGPGSFPGALASVLFPGLTRTASILASGRTCLGIMDNHKIMVQMSHLSADSRSILRSLVKRIIQITTLAGDLYFDKPYADPDIPLAKEPIIKQGQKECGLFRITEGQACIFRITQKGRICLAALGKDDYFGQYPFADFGCEPYGAAVLGTPDLATVELDQRQIIEEFDQLNEVTQRIINNAGQSLFLTIKSALEYLTG